MDKFYLNVSSRSGIIYHTYIDEYGTKQIDPNKTFKPSLFILNDKLKNPKYKTINGKAVGKNTYSLKDYMSKVFNMSKDKPLEHLNRLYYGNIQPEYQFIHDQYDKFIPTLSKIKIAYLDIEVNSDSGFPKPEYANHPVTAISLKNSENGEFYVWGLKDYDTSKLNTLLDANQIINYHHCASEIDLFDSFLNHFEKESYDIISGWNVLGFDMLYLYNRSKKVYKGKKNNIVKLSPFYMVRETPLSPDWKVRIAGVAILDYLMLYKKYMAGHRQSYKLDYIAEYELGTNKIDYSEFYNLLDLYDKNHQKFIDYNIYDTELIYKLEEKLGLIKLLMTIAYKAKCNFEDVFSPIKTWDVFIYHSLYDKGIVIPPKSYKNGNKKNKVSTKKVNENFELVEEVEAEEEMNIFAGGHVKVPLSGLHKWVITFDLNSLYPHIQMCINISAETILGYNKNVKKDFLNLDKKFLTKEIKIPLNATQAGNGYCFLKGKDNKGFIPMMLESLYNERVLVKNKMLKNIQELALVESEIKRRKLKHDKI